MRRLDIFLGFFTAFWYTMVLFELHRQGAVLGSWMSSAVNVWIFKPLPALMSARWPRRWALWRKYYFTIVAPWAVLACAQLVRALHMVGFEKNFYPHPVFLLIQISGIFSQFFATVMLRLPIKYHVPTQLTIMGLLYLYNPQACAWLSQAVGCPHATCMRTLVPMQLLLGAALPSLLLWRYEYWERCMYLKGVMRGGAPAPLRQMRFMKRLSWGSTLVMMGVQWPLFASFARSWSLRRGTGSAFAGAEAWTAWVAAGVGLATVGLYAAKKRGKIWV